MPSIAIDMHTVHCIGVKTVYSVKYHSTVINLSWYLDDIYEPIYKYM